MSMRVNFSRLNDNGCKHVFLPTSAQNRSYENVAICLHFYSVQCKNRNYFSLSTSFHMAQSVADIFIRKYTLKFYHLNDKCSLHVSYNVAVIQWITYIA